ncbi:MAG: endonuclease III [Desulfobacterales bacterium]
MKALHIDLFIERLKQSYETLRSPIVTFIANRGGTPFEILVSTILSLRTKDEVTSAAASRLFSFAKTPSEMIRLGEGKISKLIYPVGFYPTKAKRIIEISRIILEQHECKVPNTLESLLTLPGVGRKTANLVLTEGFGIPAVCVDTHVHRISNRIGYVETKTPEETEMALRKKLPKKHWPKYNEYLVAFGQSICRPVSPLCSRCPAADMCPRVGVTKSR